MKPIRLLSAPLVFALFVLGNRTNAQQPTTGSSTASSSNVTSQDKPEVSATDLITQGKALFRTAKFRPALTKFEAALKQEPDNDEALGLAAETAFRLDSQASAREYLLRRVESSGQRESVKAFCFQRVAMTYWREAHDIVAKHGELKNDKVVYALPEKELSEATQKIESGIEQATKALEMRGSFADAYNIRNLLQAEAALIADDSDDAKKYRQKSLDDLQMAMTMAKPAPDSKAGEAADFNYLLKAANPSNACRRFFPADVRRNQQGSKTILLHRPEPDAVR
jgi:tetratricopeptide (TPR) repeat protein